MSKKLIMACMAVAAFAAFVVLPATASATGPALCETVETNCVTLIPPQFIHAHGENTKLVSGGTTLVECKEATMTGQVTVNNGDKIEGTITTADFNGPEAEGKCKSSFGGPTAVDTNIGNGTPWCLSSTSTTADTWSIRGNSCSLATRPITFVLTTANIGTCKYSRTAAATGTFTTHTSSTEDAILTASPEAATEWTKEEGSILCPASGQLQMSFTLTTDDAAKTTLYIEHVA